MDNKNKSLSNLENEKVDGEKIKGGFMPIDPAALAAGPGSLPQPANAVNMSDPANLPGANQNQNQQPGDENPTGVPGDDNFEPPLIGLQPL